MEDNSVDYNIKQGLNKLWRWKLWILGAVILSGIISIFVSLRMADEFRSTVSFVPPSYSALTTMTFGNGIAYRGFYAADEEDIDRTIDYLTSPKVVDSIAGLFNLYKHYGIDMTSHKKDKMFYQTFYSKVDIDFSGNSTVVIECWDTNPGLAFEMAKTYRDIAKNYFEDVSQRRTGLRATEEAIAEMDRERTMILDSLSSLRTKYGIYHVDNTGPDIARILAERMRNEPNFHKYYDDVKSMETYLSTLELRFGDLQREYMTRKLNIEQFPSLVQITSQPTLPTFKRRPKRSVIVIFSVLATFLLASFLVIVLDRPKQKTA